MLGAAVVGVSLISASWLSSTLGCVCCQLLLDSWPCSWAQHLYEVLAFLTCSCLGSARKLRVVRAVGFSTPVSWGALVLFLITEADRISWNFRKAVGDIERLSLDFALWVANERVQN